MRARRKNRTGAAPADEPCQPRRSWSADHLLVPSPWQRRDPEWRHPLRTLAAPGQVGPRARQGWSLVLRGAQPFEADAFELNAHGFQFDQAGIGSGTGWMAAAGVLVLDLPRGVSVDVQAGDLPVRHENGWQDLEIAECTVSLWREYGGDRLYAVLATRIMEREPLHALAGACLVEPASARWRESRQPYDAFWSVQHTDEVASARALARAVDDLAAGLRSASGALPFWWMLGQAYEGEGQVTNELYDHVRAWSLVQPTVALALVKTVLSAQQEDGAIPRIVRPDGFHDRQWAPFPLLARSAWVAWQAEPSREFHDYVMPRLYRYVQWAIAYFDPERRGLPLWHDAREAWIPETYHPEVASADLPAMLAAELDALRDLSRAMSVGPGLPEPLEHYRASLGRTLASFFWNKEKTLFQDRFPTGDHVTRLTLGAALPLLDTTLPRDCLQPVAELLDHGGPLRAPTGARAWAAWSDEPSAPPVRTDHQLLILDALHGAGADEIAQRLKGDLAVTGERALDSRMAALAVAVLATSAPAERPQLFASPLLAWLDRHRTAVLGSLLAVLTVALAVVVAAFMLKRSLTVQAAETSMGMAQRMYTEQRYDEARRLILGVAESGRSFPGMYLSLGNAEFQLDNLPAAEAAYRLELKQNPNAVLASLNLALTLMHQQRPAEAVVIYQDITNRFATAYPAMAERAALALRLLEEQPPRLGSKRQTGEP